MIMPLIRKPNNDDNNNNINDNNNVIVMSEAGKPIFARHGSDQEIARICGLIQAIRTAVNGNSDLGEIQSFHASHLHIIFMSVESITLISIHKTSAESGHLETDTFARLQLEYVYAQLIFHLTDQIQTIFQHNPGYDLKSTVMSSNNLLHGLLEEMDPIDNKGNLGPFWVGGVPTVFPISHKLRRKVSQTLWSVGSKTENLAFALLVVGDKLLSLVQPAYRPHQLRNSDLQLILHFVHKQHHGLYSGELWIPMCLPRFNSSGFLHAFCHSYDAESQLTLILISSHNTPEQFQMLRAASIQIQTELGLPVTSDSVVTANSTTTPISSDKTGTGTGTTQIKRDEESFETDEDYVTIPNNLVNESSRLSQQQTLELQRDSPLLQQVRDSRNSSNFESITKTYLQDKDQSDGRQGHADETLILHFLFRYDVAVKPSSRHAAATSNGGKGHLTQCISPHPIPFPFTSGESRRRLWTYYQQLGLRLRLGSAGYESTQDAFDMIAQDYNNNPHVMEGAGGGSFPKISRHCPAMSLLESPPNVHGVTYIVEESEIFLAMNGKDFELYMVASNIMSVKEAAELGTKLVRRLMADEKNLFQTTLLTWKE